MKHFEAAYVKCANKFFGFARLDSVTAMFCELSLPTCKTLRHNICICNVFFFSQCGELNLSIMPNTVEAEVPLQPPMFTAMVQHAVVEPKKSFWEPLMRSDSVASMSVSKTASS